MSNNVIEGRSTVPSNTSPIERKRDLYKQIDAAKEGLTIDIRRCIIEVRDMGKVFITTEPNKAGKWNMITEFKIKPMENNYHSLMEYLDMLFASLPEAV